MYRLFNTLTKSTQGIITPPLWVYVKQGLQRNLQIVTQYYRTNPMAVNSSHFLVRLLQSITIPQSMNLERYYANVDAISLKLSMAMKMTSSIFKGQLFDGVFYGPNSLEVLIADNESFDIVEANKNWEDLCPVQVLRHPKSDLGLNLLDGTNTGSETGLAVIVINIPMLALQYRAFRYNEIYLSKSEDTEDGDSQKSIMQFVHMYVLPNMLYSHLDQAIFNRIDNFEKGAPLGKSKKNHPFYLTDWSSKLNQIHGILLNNLKTTKRNFFDILKTIPMVTCENAAELMIVPDLVPTRQVIWALSISRLNVLSFIFRVFEEGAGIKNQSEINYVLKQILNYRTNNLMKSILPLDVYFDIENDINELITTSRTTLLKA